MGTNGDSRALALAREETPAPLAAYMPTNLDAAMHIAELLARSGAMPYNTPGEVFAVSMAGARFGLDPMTSCRLLYVIKDKGTAQVGITANGARALIEASGRCEAFDLVDDPSANDFDRATFRCKRTGRDEQLISFTQADARRAGLWGKKTAKGYDTPWTSYPGEMLIARATMKAARLIWADVLGGFYTRDEITSGAAADPDLMEADFRPDSQPPRHAQQPEPQRRSERQRQREPAPETQPPPGATWAAASAVLMAAGIDPTTARCFFMANKRDDPASDDLDPVDRRRRVDWLLSEKGRATFDTWLNAPPATRKATWADMLAALDALGIPPVAYARWREVQGRDPLGSESDAFHIGGSLHKLERADAAAVLAWMDEQHSAPSEPPQADDAEGDAPESLGGGAGW